MIYEVVFSDEVYIDLAKLRKNEPSAFKKANKLIKELYEHPESGTVKPERLKGGEVWAVVKEDYSKTPINIYN